MKEPSDGGITLGRGSSRPKVQLRIKENQSKSAQLILFLINTDILHLLTNPIHTSLREY